MIVIIITIMSQNGDQVKCNKAFCLHGSQHTRKLKMVFAAGEQNKQTQPYVFPGPDLRDHKLLAGQLCHLSTDGPEVVAGAYTFIYVKVISISWASMRSVCAVAKADLMGCTCHIVGYSKCWVLKRKRPKIQITLVNKLFKKSWFYN